MIIRSKRPVQEFGMEFEGDKFIFHHTENITPIIEQNYFEREYGNNGWTDDRGFRRIASIPALEAVRIEKKYPGIFQDASMMRRYLMSEEGELFRTVKKGI